MLMVERYYVFLLVKSIFVHSAQKWIIIFNGIVLVNILIR